MKKYWPYIITAAAAIVVTLIVITSFGTVSDNKITLKKAE